MPYAYKFNMIITFNNIMIGIEKGNPVLRKYKSRIRSNRNRPVITMIDNILNARIRSHREYCHLESVASDLTKELLLLNKFHKRNNEVKGC